ncbi:hypothetical protein [Streptomyces spirodelae]|uniref:Uncharacterized protein n=1 Tax=Streptomyces spirodelae TaxID=2812904 RepID=A0ABS3WX61_9ACTN|nr:hypothetical protein [Streptomyces spirodelae]MBO8187729.1 hypothetical protein [Streptomyces spirodelae]
MRSERRLRRLVVGGTTWLWTVRHRHPYCREVLSLHRAGPRRTLRIVFRTVPEHRLTAGYPQSGVVVDALGRSLNLNEPGNVRRLLDQAVARTGACGRPSGAGFEVELDGWTLFDVLRNGDGLMGGEWSRSR